MNSQFSRISLRLQSMTLMLMKRVHYVPGLVELAHRRTKGDNDTR